MLLALSANSPFWQGTNSGYASYRYQAWSRWPTAGPTEQFGSLREYRRHVETLLASGVLLDEGMVYFDARLSHIHPTVEVRARRSCAADTRGAGTPARHSWTERSTSARTRAAMTTACAASMQTSAMLDAVERTHGTAADHHRLPRHLHAT
ncbi:hypothetical protein QFZ70_000803 [Arthrobacter sp. V1I9]|uniref:glutamate-cysteine ligase family protein n=1 Tax=Arthrobacter sp. V1I9 TaxID=3042275 RepID=UPI00278EB5EF|nr:glutamate-cysteine ligase family protein [Arthrobacter sp. V1I9]MDQ0868330.1 hypothetical protein [Arthrobacter sp. V1I9]